jgi:hypothetical protein
MLQKIPGTTNQKASSPPSASSQLAANERQQIKVQQEVGKESKIVET